ncbi:hypothetical protein ES703_97257 [subsurface metagenome]
MFKGAISWGWNIIDSYQFGLIIVSGQKYNSDIIVFPDRVRDDWWRKTGHQLCLKDIAEVITENPEVLVVGTGASGLMKVLPEVERGVEAQGIKLIVEATDKACHTYNHVCHSQRAIAALHITC